MDESPNKNLLGKFSLKRFDLKRHLRKLDLKKLDPKKFNLKRFDLKKLNLSKFDLSGLQLKKFNLKKIDLKRFNFTRIKLTGKKTGMIFIAVMIFFIGMGLYISNTGYSIFVNGVPVGIVKSKVVAEEVITELAQKIEEDYNDASLVIGADLKIEKTRLSDKQPVSKDVLKDNIMKSMTIKKPAVTVKINGKPVVSLLEKEQAENILEDIENCFVENGEGIEINSIYIKEKIEMVEEPVEIKDLISPEDAYKYLLNGTTEEKIYTVKKGDSLWLISKNNNISVEKLEKANPGINPKRLQIGQKISLVVPKPFITVVSEETATNIENIPYETEYKESSEFYKGESIVKKYGKYGEKEITSIVIKENGNEISREILEEKVIKNPVTRLVALGTRPPPPRQGTGTFSYPARGRITSGFGWRWGRRHTGIDIALNVGTPVKAADGGTVKFSGSYGGYGNLVIIDHGGDYETYYGHNSKLLVKKGDKVFKGQTISLSGSTGNSTGPHLHFEVRKFGVPTDPTKYLNQ